jgi:hypothetical protein
MVAPPFPLLLVVPAVAVDFILLKVGNVSGWKNVLLAAVLGEVFMAILICVQWFFSGFIVQSPHAQNWFFIGDRVWDYGSQLGNWTHEFWDRRPDNALFTVRALMWCWVLATVNCWLGLLLGGWMRKVQR